MLEIIVGFIVYVLVGGTSLWAGLKLTGIDGKFLGMLVIAAIATGISLLWSLVNPLVFLDSFVSWIVMLVFLYRWTDTDLMGAILVTAVTEVVCFMAGLVLVAAILGG